MRVLITGVTGYLGRALCAAITADGHDVAGTSRNPGAAREAMPGLSRAFGWSPMDGPLQPSALVGVDAVVHLAGERVAPRWNADRKRLIYDTRVTGTRNLVRGLEAARVRPQVLLSASAVGYYGHRRDDELTEAEPPGRDFLARVCRDWEEEAQAASALGVRVVSLRIAPVVGTGSPFLEAVTRPFKSGVGGRLGSGKQWWPWAHVSDVAGLVSHAIADDALAGPLNVVSPNPIRQRVFAKTLGRVLRRPAFVCAPALSVRLMLGEFAHEVLNSRRVLPTAALDSGYVFEHEELEEALEQALWT